MPLIYLSIYPSMSLIYLSIPSSIYPSICGSIYLQTYLSIELAIHVSSYQSNYGAVSISRLLKNIGLFCKRAL